MSAQSARRPAEGHEPPRQGPTVRAKFQVVNVKTGTVNVGGTNEAGQYEAREVPVATVNLCPVYGGSPENDAFFVATPTGEIRFQSVNLAAAEVFASGQQFYVDFTPAD